MIAIASENVATRALDQARGAFPAQVPFFDLSAQHEALDQELSAAMREVVLSGRCILGSAVEDFEAEFARRVGVRHVVAVGSGTDALVLSLRSLGLAPGSEVVTSPFTFVATASSIVQAGYRPVFADIDAASWCLDPAAVEVALTSRTGALLPVHLFGRVADLRDLDKIRQARGIQLVEDAAQSFGSSLGGRAAGTWGRAGCFSFYPTKNLGAAGDAGAIATDDESLARHARRLRAHGDAGRFEHVELGGTHRMDALQAAILRVKLPHAQRWIARRAQIVETYRQGLAGTEFVLPESGANGERVAWNQFCVRHPRRDEVRDHLRCRGVGSEVYYPVPLHLQPCFSWLGHSRGDFPVSEALASTILALPLYPELDESRIQRVIEALLEFDGANRGGSFR